MPQNTGSDDTVIGVASEVAEAADVEDSVIASERSSMFPPLSMMTPPFWEKSKKMLLLKMPL